jgi:hypothetical protein
VPVPSDFKKSLVIFLAAAAVGAYVYRWQVMVAAVLLTIVLELVPHLLFDALARRADKALRLEVVALGPEGMTTRHGKSRWETVPWSKISRVTLARAGVGVHVFRRDIQTVVDMDSVFRTRADAARLVDAAQGFLAQDQSANAAQATRSSA